MHYILTLSYRGAGLSGWQIQNNAVTVQGELDRALGILFGTPVQTIGAGRTDAGVNATNYVCDFETPFPTIAKLADCELVSPSKTAKQSKEFKDCLLEHGLVRFVEESD